MNVAIIYLAPSPGDRRAIRLRGFYLTTTRGAPVAGPWPSEREARAAARERGWEVE